MYGYYYGYDYSYFIFMLPAIILTLWAQIKVNSTFNEYKSVISSRKLTGAQAAKRVLMDNGITDVQIEHVGGSLSDHYDPRTNVIRLSDDVYNNTSVAAIGVAAHEAGHAVQHAQNYVPVKVRGALVPVVNIGSSLSWLLIIAGFMIPNHYTLLTTLGIIFFSLAVLFQVVTLPVEINASRRAIKALEAGNLLYDDELVGAKKVLFAAAMTYIAAAMTSILQLLRLVLIYLGRRNDD